PTGLGYIILGVAIGVAFLALVIGLISNPQAVVRPAKLFGVGLLFSTLGGWVMHSRLPEMHAANEARARAYGEDDQVASVMPVHSAAPSARVTTVTPPVPAAQAPT